MPGVELEILTQAAKSAGEIALQYFGKSPKVWQKDDDQGPVSEADLAVNDFLHEFFERKMPQCVLLSEEDEDDPTRLGASNVLVVDPIDGTKAYLEGQDYFAISIALLQNDQPVAGVVFAPALNDLYQAEHQRGAFCNGQPLRISKETELEKARILASRARYNRSTLEKHPKLNSHFRPSIALRLALVAKGQFDLTAALRPSWDWDLAAGHILVREAGGQILDREGKFPKYNQESAQQNGIVAGPMHLVEEFLKRI